MKQKKNESKLSKEAIERRLQFHQNTKEIEAVVRELTDPNYKPADTSEIDIPLISIASAGLASEQFFEEVANAYKEFLDKVGIYAFSNAQKERYFHNSKIKPLYTILKRAGMAIVARTVLDIFKDRVKQIHGGKMPTVTAKTGLFGKETTRPMKLEEIAAKIDIEEDIPPGVDRPLTAVGTQAGILSYVRGSLLENEEIVDPLKKGPRKALFRFLQAAQLIDIHTEDPNHKGFLACLSTPDTYQPNSTGDNEGLSNFHSILFKANKWLDTQIGDVKQDEEDPPSNGEE